jgi:transposase/FtsZ-binding cell division protein ZapB
MLNTNKTLTNKGSHRLSNASQEVDSATFENDIKALYLELSELQVRMEANEKERGSLQSVNETLQSINAALEQENKLLRERIRLLLAQRYGRRSEAAPSNIPSLFDEAELNAAGISPVEEADASEEEPPAETATTEPKKRRKRGRRVLPAGLPRIEVIHELPESARICEIDHQIMQEIGREISEQLDIIPAQVRVIQNIRIKYGCPHCHHGVLTSPMPEQPIPKSNASPGLLAHVTVSKYEDHLPLYRQERILQRIGVDIPRATLSNWMVFAGGKLVQPLINLLRDQLLDYDIMQMDETTVQVLKEPGRTAENKSQIWVQRGGSPDTPVILFNYDPSRSGKTAADLLEGFQGYLQTDAYVGYKTAMTRLKNIVLVGCMAHLRRKFDEALKGSEVKGRSGIAGEALKRIQKLYVIEKRLREAQAPPETRLEVRQKESRPILDDTSPSIALQPDWQGIGLSCQPLD